ncbi:MAG TPA: hypothetical protein VGF53_10085 [Pseudolabrys sp.]|jgi:hypothetical protein
MDRFNKYQFTPAHSETQPDTVRGPATVVAAWPSGVSSLARAVDACQRHDTRDMGTDWLARAPNSIVLPPAC